MADDFAERVITPAMPICMAYVCCILNFLIPGSGTVIAGISIFCCARNEDMTVGDKCTSCCCGLLLGLLQLIFTGFLLIGWCWSAVWGFSYLQMSRKHYPRNGMRRQIHPVTSQPTRRRITSNHQCHSGGNPRMEIVVVSQQPCTTIGPPPSYYGHEQSLSTEALEAPPSYSSLFP